MNESCLKNSQQGMTLIEILVAMTLGAFLLTGVMQIFLNSKQTYRMQDNLSRMQENGRFAMEFIGRDIRKADYRECYTDVSINNSVTGVDNAGLNNSDSISIIYRGDPEDNTPPVCGGANTTIAYTIQNDVSGQPALYKSSDGAQPQSLIEGIENMQILYGVDLAPKDSTADYYVAAGSAGLPLGYMNDVISIRISLLIRSLDNNLAPAPTAYVFNGASTTPGDRRLRRVFTSTIVLRNRIQ